MRRELALRAHWLIENENQAMDKVDTASMMMSDLQWQKAPLITIGSLDQYGNAGEIYIDDEEDVQKLLEVIKQHFRDKAGRIANDIAALGRPAVPNPEFEAAVQDMIQQGSTPPPKLTEQLQKLPLAKKNQAPSVWVEKTVIHQ